jgi:hypothetical protein
MSGKVADKLMRLCSEKYSQMAEHWYQDLITNPKTEAYRKLDKENCIRHAEYTYKNMERMFFSDDIEKEVIEVLSVEGIFEERFARNIPLEQVIYATILLRRHIWLCGETQVIYNEDMIDVFENFASVSRVIQVFDNIITMAATMYAKLSAELE